MVRALGATPEASSRRDDGAAGAERSGTRNPFWDSLRFVAISLVVVGHSIAMLRDSDSMATLYAVIYAVHMPLFAFVSGRFAGGGPISARSMMKIVTSLIVPYLVFSSLWFLVRSAVEGDVRLNLASPYAHLWFLLALTVWRLTLPLFATLRWPVTVSVLFGVSAGYVPSIGPVLDSGRVLGMLPFFVLGWAVHERDLLAGLRTRKWDDVAPRTLAVLVLAAATGTAWVGIELLREVDYRGWLLMAANYHDLGVSAWWAGGVRVALYALALLLCGAVMVLIPRGVGILSRWGASTMYVYMLHLFPIYLLRTRTHFLDWFNSAPRFGLLIVLAIGLACALSTRLVRVLTGPVVQPRLGWLFREGLRSPERAMRQGPVRRAGGKR